MVALAGVPVLMAMAVTGVPQASAGTQVVRLTAHPARTAPLQPSVLTGHLPASRPRPVTLQARHHGHWEAVSSARTSSTGSFRFTVTAHQAVGHVTRYRVHAASAGSRAAATTTPIRTVTTVNPITLVSRWPKLRYGEGGNPEMSPNGRYIAYYPYSPSQVLVDRVTGSHTRIPAVDDRQECEIEFFDWVSRKNRIVPSHAYADERAAHPGDSNYDVTCNGYAASRNGRFHLESAALWHASDGPASLVESEVLLYDSRHDTWRKVPVRPFGSPPVSDDTTTTNLTAVAVSDDASKVVFGTSRTTTVDNEQQTRYDLFVYDADTDTTTLITHTPDGSPSATGPSRPFYPPWVVLTSTGSKVYFYSTSTDLVPSGDSGLFGYHVGTGALELVNPMKQQPVSLVTSRTGRYVAWGLWKNAPRIGPWQGARVQYLDTKTGILREVLRKLSGELPTRNNYPRMSMSADGRLLAFDSQNIRLVAHPSPDRPRVYLFHAAI